MQYIFGLRIWDKLWCYWGIYWVHTKHATWVLQLQPIAWREIIFLILFITIFGLGFCRFTYLGYLLWFILIILSSCDHFFLKCFLQWAVLIGPSLEKTLKLWTSPYPNRSYTFLHGLTWHKMDLCFFAFTFTHPIYIFTLTLN